MSRRPARDVTRGGSVKNKNKNPESKCLRLREVAWKIPEPARRPRRRGRADREGAREAQSGPGRPPAPHPCDSGRGAPRGSAGAQPHAGGAPRPAEGRRPCGGGPEAGGAQRGPAGLHVRAGGGGRAERSRPAPSRAGRDARAGTAGRRWRPERAQAGVSAGERVACMRAALAWGGRGGGAGAGGKRTRRGARSAGGAPGPVWTIVTV